MPVDWIDPKISYKVIMIKGTSGNANGLLEYVCEADAGASTAAAVWRIRKLVYDSASFNTQILWASGNTKFDKIADSASSYSYS